MSVVSCGQTGADIEELTNPCTARQIPDRAGQESSLGADSIAEARDDSKNLFRELAIDRIVVLTAQQIVPEPS
jgi:hypothetical protein